MQEVLENIIAFSLIFICSNAIHEFAHLLGCWFFKCRVVDLKVPFFVLYRDGKTKAFWITFLGPIIDLVIVAILAVVTINWFFMWGVLLAGIVILFFWIYNLLPNIKGDGALLYSVFKEK